jgi:hypothetical protein
VQFFELRLQQGRTAVTFHRQSQVPAIALGLGFTVHTQGTKSAAFGGSQHPDERAFGSAQSEFK